ncbi:MAG: ABC transporter permease [Candidatus Thalassarchaeaceae archaeon]
MDKKGLSLKESVWSQLDRKAGAIIELTIRQLRHRLSTWVVLGVGVLIMLLLLAFYVDSVRDGFESIDNDGDSVDEDEDGYPLGQEIKYGHSDFDSSQYPGVGKYIPVGEIDGNDLLRNISGNYSWFGQGILDPVWIDMNYTGNEWDPIINWQDEISTCPEGEAFTDWALEYGSACIYGNGKYVFAGEFQASGSVEVPMDYFLAWGIYTDSFYVEPDPISMYIDEDDINWDGILLQSSQGFDDDGDCTRENWSEDSDWIYVDDSGEVFDNDKNGNGIICDVQWILDGEGNVIEINKDSNVDEDPIDEKFMGESSHRTFIIGVGKMAFVILLGLFLPLFLSLGLIRDETENGTLHYLLSKPIHRGEFIIYRLLGYLTVTGTYILFLSLFMGLFSSLLGPGENIIRLSDMPIWLGIGFATILVLCAYGALFNTLALISPKYGIYVCISIGVWEFVMGILTIANPNWTISAISINHWALQIIDSIVLIAWPDTLQLQQMSLAFNLETGLDIFWKPPAHTLGTSNPLVSIFISITMLSLFTVSMLGIGQSIFKNREIM